MSKIFELDHYKILWLNEQFVLKTKRSQTLLFIRKLSTKATIRDQHTHQNGRIGNTDSQVFTTMMSNWHSHALLVGLSTIHGIIY